MRVAPYPLGHQPLKRLLTTIHTPERLGRDFNPGAVPRNRVNQLERDVPPCPEGCARRQPHSSSGDSQLPRTRYTDTTIADDERTTS
jgi:hypothetical protein